MSSAARIHDRGFRHYDGPRLGPSAAVRALARHTFGALLGRRRSIWAKLLTVVVAGIAFVPAIVFVGLALIVPANITDVLLPGSSDYLGLIFIPVTVFVVLGAPVALCPDRRSGALALYLASPLDRDTYLLAKAAAVWAFLTIVTVGPAVLLVIGLVLLGRGPEGAGEVTVALVRALLAGGIYSLLFGSVSLAISSLTERRAAAAAGAALFILASGAILRGTFVELLNLPQAVALLDVGTAAGESVSRIYGEVGDLDELNALVVHAAWVAWVVAAGWFARWRYHRLQVTR